MTKAQDRLIKSIGSQNFEKFISVAHKDNGEDFFYKVHLLYFMLIFLSSIFTYSIVFNTRMSFHSCTWWLVVGTWILLWICYTLVSSSPEVIEFEEEPKDVLSLMRRMLRRSKVGARVGRLSPMPFFKYLHVLSPRPSFNALLL